MASGFHGGGGGFKTDEAGMEGNPTGSMCGALASGVLILGILYGRTEPGKVRFGCISHLSAHLHKRFPLKIILSQGIAAIGTYLSLCHVGEPVRV
jgi:hypothetical protein